MWQKFLELRPRVDNFFLGVFVSTLVGFPNVSLLKIMCEWKCHPRCEELYSTFSPSGDNVQSSMNTGLLVYGLIKENCVTHLQWVCDNRRLKQDLPYMTRREVKQLLGAAMDATDPAILECLEPFRSTFIKILDS